MIIQENYICCIKNFLSWSMKEKSLFQSPNLLIDQEVYIDPNQWGKIIFSEPKFAHWQGDHDFKSLAHKLHNLIKLTNIQRSVIDANIRRVSTFSKLFTITMGWWYPHHQVHTWPKGQVEVILNSSHLLLINKSTTNSIDNISFHAIHNFKLT